ncbi:MAG: hypothetical protein VX794_08690 [Nitrospinota bacterium]|nr:hypothetical protein [Nitrospinota bacterium]
MDNNSKFLPCSYEGLKKLQEEFDVYQSKVFPTRESRFFALELAGEVGELANLEKKEWKGRKIKDSDFVDETADAMIALMNYANSKGVDLSSAVSKKMKKIDEKRIVEPEA